MTDGISGFRFAGCSAGIKKSGAPDLGLIVADEPAVTATVFTKNLVRAAPVEVAMEHTRDGRAQALLVNSGNANACTGEAGLRVTVETTRAAAKALGVAPEDVVPASTGVIGELLPEDKIVLALPDLVKKLRAEGVDEFAQAILTTDRWKKVATGTLSQGSRVLGIAKGAGMIHPNLGPPQATMLAFILTDAVVERGDLQAALEWATDASFNACSVDGDTSTNDMVIALGSGKSGTAADAKVLYEGLLPVCKALAHEMVLDGEGAEHAVEIEVVGLENDLEARVVAETVATSMLVKTALYGRDPNWGRLLAAAGRADVAFDPRKARISIGGIVVYDRGKVHGHVMEAEAKKVMQEKSYSILIDLGSGPGKFSYLTSDLGHGYIDVNAGYRT